MLFLQLLATASVLITTALSATIHHDRRQSPARGTKYLLGVGKGDITGPVVEIGMMGYASLDQKGTGLLQRLYSRAFIVASPNTPSSRLLYIISDIASGDVAIQAGLLNELQKLYPGVYTYANVAFVGTHSHAGPGAFFNYLLPQVTTLGFDQQSYRAIVDGTVRAVKRAHEGLAPGYLTLGKGNVRDGGVNRSPYAYEQNPAAERARYSDNVDTEMTLLGFEKENGEKLGILNWYPTHGTSLYNNHTLIAGDNKGFAALKFEKEVGGGFVAGFSQSNMGDVSPNTLGAVCEDTGLPCKYEDSTCGGKTQMCKARGPLFRALDNGVSSCAEIGERQYTTAKAIWEKLETEGTPVVGEVRSVHQFVDMGSYKFKAKDGSEKRTCKAALGFSFAAGTTDGPGAFDFTQNDPGAPKNPFWLLVRNILRTPSPDQVECQKPKPILLAVGEMDTPYAWSPNVVPIQLARIGQLSLIIAPGEATTMSGRRWKSALSSKLEELGILSARESGWTVLSGPANTYSHYIVTPEEYTVQRYEGASTMYGQWTLDAYISITNSLAPYLANTPPATPLPKGPSPPVHTSNSINLNTGVVQDNPPLGKKFGQVLTAPSATYPLPTSSAPLPTVVVKFVGANPRNNLRHEGTFGAIDRESPDGSGTWRRYRDDDDWDLTYEWKRTEVLTGQSEVTVKWALGKKGGRPVERGRYRVRYWGDSRRLIGGRVEGFEGVSGGFRVL